MSKFNVEILPVEKALLGEGPHWDETEEILYYVDIMSSTVYRYKPETKESFKLKIDGDCLGERTVSLVIPVKGKTNEFIIGHGRSLKHLKWDFKSSEVKHLSTLYDAKEENNLDGRFNDGKCSSTGTFWAGTMAPWTPNPPPEDLTKGSLYKMDRNCTVTKQVANIGISNGLAWSPDNKIFYYIDSYAMRIDAFDYDSVTETISNRRIAFDFITKNVEGVPDGMTIDANGNLWVACFGASQVICVDPVAQKLITTVKLPASDITSVTFGGKNLDVLFATSSTHYLNDEKNSSQPDAGKVFKISNLGVKGLSAGIPYSGKV